MLEFGTLITKLVCALILSTSCSVSNKSPWLNVFGECRKRVLEIGAIK
jgi:hypothetical protein